MAGGQGRALGSGSTPDALLAKKNYNQLNSSNIPLLKGACREMGAFLLSKFVVG